MFIKFESINTQARSLSGALIQVYIWENLFLIFNMVPCLSYVTIYKHTCLKVLQNWNKFQTRCLFHVTVWRPHGWLSMYVYDAWIVSYTDSEQGSVTWPQGLAPSRQNLWNLSHLKITRENVIDNPSSLQLVLFLFVINFLPYPLHWSFQ